MTSIVKNLIITPLKKEKKELLQGIGKDFAKEKLGRLDVHISKNWIVACGGHGKVQAGVQASYLLSQLEDVENVFCVGVAGALSPEVKKFDVVLGEKTIEHDYKEKFTPAPPPSFKGNLNALEFSFSDFSVHQGGVASGDEDIVDQNRAQSLFEETQALAVAWEGAGVARAARFYQKTFLEIRAISDDANSSAPEDFLANLSQCMLNAQKTLRKICEY